MHVFETFEECTRVLYNLKQYTPVLCTLVFFSEEQRNAEMLQSQMAEVRRREEEAVMLEQQQHALLQQQWELEEAVSWG